MSLSHPAPRSKHSVPRKTQSDEGLSDQPGWNNYINAGRYKDLTVTLDEGTFPRAAEAKRTDNATALKAREQTYNRLRSAYREFARLAKADLKAEIQGAVEGLAGSYENLITASKKIGADLPALPDGLTGVFSEALVFTARERQGRLIEEANDVFIGVLPGLIEFVKKERNITVNILQAVAHTRPRFREVVNKRKLGDLSPIIKRITDLAGV